MREDDVEIIREGTSVKTRGKGNAREALVNEHGFDDVGGFGIGTGGGGK